MTRTLAEWRHVQETEPATPRQVGAIMGHFRRLNGLDHPALRSHRLTIMAALLGAEHVSSVNDLTRGEAGYLVEALGRYRDTRDLAADLARIAVDNLNC